MKLSFCTMGYLEYCTAEETVRRVARHGYDGIDFWAYSPHLGPDIYDKEDRKKIRELVKQHNLEITGLSVNGGTLALHLNLSHSNPKVRKQALDYLLDCIELAVDIECPIVNLISGHKVYPTTQEEAWEWNKEATIKVADEGEKKGIVVALHSLTPCESNVMVTLDDLIRMKNEIGHKNIKLCIDTADQNVTDPNLYSAILKAGDDLVYFHVNDNFGEKRGDIHWPPGRGNINWELVLVALKEINYKGCLMVQSHNIGGPIDIDGWALEAKRYLDPLIEKIF